MSLQEHLRHIGSAVQRFIDQNGDEDEWDDYQIACHDKLLERINREDGWTRGESTS